MMYLCRDKTKEKKMKTFLKFLSRNKLYTLVNVIGLSISLAFVIIIGLYSQMEFGRDRWHEKADRIYLVTTDMEAENSFEGSHYYMQELLRSQFPEIESSCGLMMEPMDMTLADQEKASKQIMFVDSTFFSLFDFPLTMGSRQHSLSEPGSIVLTEETARLLFGATDPMGKTVTLRDSMAFTVTGVMPPLNHTALKPCDAIVGIEVQQRLSPFSFDESMHSYGNTLVMLLAKEGADLKAREADINQMLSKRIDFFKPDASFGQMHLRLLPLTELYFSDAEPIFTNRGDYKQSELLFIVGLVILLFAVMNYVNLTVAQSGFRMREMAMRRLLGSQRSHIIGRLIAESVLLCFLSLAVALLLVYCTVPYANQLVGSATSDFFWMNTSANADIPIIQFADLWKPQSVCLLLLSVVLQGVVAGMAPAIVTSSAQPIEVVRGAFTRRTKMYFSRLFITAQHVITITLIAVSFVMWLQVRHLLNAPLGYNTERLMEVRTNSWDDGERHHMKQLSEEVRHLSCIESAVLGIGTPLMRGSNQTEEFEGRNIPFQHFWTEKGWLQLLGIKVLEDYGTTGYDDEVKQKRRVFVTPKALAAENLPRNARSIKFQNVQLQIDGVIDDIHLKDILYTDQRPVIVQEYENIGGGPSVLMRYRGDKREVRRQVAEHYKQIFGKDMMESHAFYFFDDQMRTIYANHIRIQQLITVFTCVALLISLLGLLAMSTYYVQQRRKEIAVRKVFGSTNRQMLLRLLRQFALYVVVAFMLATPIIYYIVTDWLEQFSYRIVLSPWIFAVSGFTCFIISLLTVLIQSWRAASENPVNNIKTE